MSELISEELFDQFRNSGWPEQFSGMAQHARTEGVAVDELESFSAYEIGLIITPKEGEQMLKDMGIVEDHLLRRGFVYIPRFSEFGKQVITACENLYTPEELEAVNEAARPEVERLSAEIVDALIAEWEA